MSRGGVSDREAFERGSGLSKRDKTQLDEYGRPIGDGESGEGGQSGGKKTERKMNSVSHLVGVWRKSEREAFTTRPYTRHNNARLV